MEDIVWPCRGVAEYAYCPRLFYYMTVEGVFVPSHDTEAGARVHKRVDKPSAVDRAHPITGGSDKASPLPRGTEPGEGASRSQPDSVGNGEHAEITNLHDSVADPDRPRTVRSLALTSVRYGITGKLDLAEIVGERATPVEYRKGRPKRTGPASPHGDELMEDVLQLGTVEAWPTDRVQVGLQAILLEEAGFTVTEAVIYYASEKLRLTLVVDDALKQEALRTLADAKRASQGPRPMPLVNDPRCPRCSLQPICLPDEVNHQRLSQVTISAGDAAVSASSTATSGEASTPKTGPANTGVDLTPRRLWPPRDDGIQLVLQREGVRVGVRGHSVRITDKDGSVVRDLPLANIESLALLGGVQVSTQALAVFADQEVPVAFLSAAGRLVAMMDPMGPTSAAVRLAQVRVLDRPEKALELAKAVVHAKIHNQRTLLMRNHPSLPDLAANTMLMALRDAEKAQTMDELRGHEGNAAAMYFRHFAGMFKPTAEAIAREFDSNGRKRRPPPDPVNSTISFGYAMLANECVASARLASLEPTIGALHAARPGRPALALDLMEPFRPLIADSVAISAFNRGELVEGHFQRTAAGCAMTDSGRKAFFSAYGRRMETEVTHPVFEYRLSYRRMLMLHARLVAAWLLGEIPSLAFLTTR